MLDDTPLPPAIVAINGIDLKDFESALLKIIKSLKVPIKESDPKHFFRVIKKLQEFPLTEISELISALKDLQQLPVYETYMTQKQEPNLGNFVGKMCDRYKQVNDFNDFFVSNIRKNQGLPQIYLVHGEENECHDSLVERLIHTRIKQISQKMWGKHKGIVSYKKIPWPYEGELIVRQRHLSISLFMEFEPTYMNDNLSATALSNLSFLSLNPLIIIQHEIRATRWDAFTEELITWYLNEFWASIDVNANKPQFLIFLNIIYPKALLIRRLKVWMKRKRFDKNRVQKRLKQIISSDNSGCPCLMFEELLPITLDDVKDWFSIHNIYDSEKIRQELAERIFKTADGRFAEYKSMADIEHDLNIIHQEFLKKKGFCL